MKKKKIQKIFALFFILSLLFGLAGILNAQTVEVKTVSGSSQAEDVPTEEVSTSVNPTTTNESIPEVKLDENITAEDMEINEPTLLPNNPFYFTKSIWRAVKKAATFNAVERAELEIQYADEKLLEAQKMAEKRDIDPEIIGKAVEGYEKEIERIRDRALEWDKINEDRKEKFLNKFSDHQIKHQKILDKLQKNVPEDIFIKIKEKREQILEKFGEVMNKWDDPEKFQERMEKTIKNQNGSNLKHLKHLEILKSMGEKMPDGLKNQLIEIENTTRELLGQDLKRINQNERFEKVELYLDQTGGDSARRLEILHDLEEDSGDLPSDIKSKLNELKNQTTKRFENRLENLNTGQLRQQFMKYLENGDANRLRTLQKLENDIAPRFKEILEKAHQQSSINLYDRIKTNPELQKKIKKYSPGLIDKLKKGDIDLHSYELNKIKELRHEDIQKKREEQKQNEEIKMQNELRTIQNRTQNDWQESDEKFKEGEEGFKSTEDGWDDANNQEDISEGTHKNFDLDRIKNFIQ